jgi:hypothetical protein
LGKQDHYDLREQETSKNMDAVRLEIANLQKKLVTCQNTDREVQDAPTAKKKK